MFAAYQPLPSSENTYHPPRSEPPRQSLSRLLPWPPSNPLPGPPYPLRPTKSRFIPNHIIRYALAVTGGLIILHYVIIGAFPNSTYTIKFREKFTGYKVWEADEAYKAATASAENVLSHLNPSAGQPGTFFRDSFPIRSMLAFWELAEKEVAAKGLDTCNDQLGRGLVEGYHSSELAYCLPPGEGDVFEAVNTANMSAGWDAASGEQVPATRISCSPVQDNDFTNWWPYPAAPCVSTNLRTIPNESRRYRAAGCEITEKGVKLNIGMGREKFLGAQMESVDMDDERAILTNAIHSVGAGASLLSAMGVGKSYSCASTITWAASHYYRHLFGLLPPSTSSASTRLQARRPINVLWLSRAKLDHYAKEHNDWSSWRDIRHINNEKELVARLKDGLRTMCDQPSSVFGPPGCVFEDARETPESWMLSSPDSIESDDSPLPVRFAQMDPSVQTIENQVSMVGHTTVLVGSHGGALGLSLFLPPGSSTIVELQVSGVKGNYHFQHMAYEMGHQYEVMDIERTVDVDQVWESVQRWVEKIAAANGS
ncbi:hypothetical protein I307_04843 [Cryptococcus deuterogattii 99/473]|uniref:Uncharacterized protein n=1 Tax=Cryptococcus deuterogattii Ram5 TaxID=1296110 RepID=A0A0D0T2Y1_9TREE|nr:hypothetical protein I313_03978 [Cryptococcus deuterogattii Ram5]KIY55904.1 hypothetical protein I307_04843 [Cryptococcus deuterogattii 99/473]